MAKLPELPSARTLNNQQVRAIAVALTDLSPEAATRLPLVTVAIQGVLGTPENVPDILAALVATLNTDQLERFMGTLNTLVAAAEAATDPDYPVN